MNRLLPALALFVAVAAGAFYLWNGSAPGTTSLPGITAANAQSADVDLDAARAAVPDITIGNPDAKVEVIEYASFTCPHCASFHKNVFKDLKANYIDTEKISFTYREVYFDRFGLWAAMVARCADPVRYFGVSDLIYSGQKDWIGDGQPATIAANLRTIGKQAGLTDEALDACFNDGAKAEQMVAVYQANADADGINSTPSFIINGKSYSNMTYTEFAATLDELLAE